MKTEIENIVEDFHRDTYWTRLHIYSGDQKTTILACASLEYLWDHFGTREISKDSLEKWAQEVIKKWEAEGTQVFSRHVHYDVYATTEEGVQNGRSFLQKEVTP